MEEDQSDLPSSSDAEIRARIEGEHTRLLVTRIRLVLTFLIFARTAQVLSDFRTQPADLPLLTLSAAVFCAILLACVVLLRGDIPLRRAIAVSVAASSSAVLLMSLAHVLRDDTGTLPPLLMIVVIGVAVLIPWGWRTQACLAAAAQVGFIINVVLLNGSVLPAFGYLGLALLTVGALSAVLAHELERTRLVGVEREVAREQRIVALRRSETALLGLFDRLEDIFYRTDAAGRLLVVSPSVERYGYAPDALIGRDVTLVFGESTTRDGILEALVTHGSVSDCELVLRRADGTPVLFSMSAMLLRDADGNPAGTQGLLRDITLRKRGEIALAEKSEQLQTLTDAMGAYLEAADWRSASATLLRGALAQTDSLYGVAGVVLGGSTLRILAREGYRPPSPADAGSGDNPAKAPGADGDAALESFLQQAISSGSTVRENTLAGDADPSSPAALRHVMAVPIRKAGEVVGVIAVANRVGGYADGDERRLDFLCPTAGAIYAAYRQTQHAAALRRARDRQQQQISALLDVAKDIGGAFELGEMFTRVQRRTSGLLPCERMVVLSWDVRRRSYTLLSHYGGASTWPASLEFSADSSFADRLQRQEAVVVAAGPQCRDADLLASLHATALAAIPLQVRGRAIGALVALRDDNAGCFDAAQIELLEGIACHLALAIDASQTLSSVSPIGIFRVDADGYCVYINERSAEILGRTPAEALGQASWPSIHPEDRDRVLGDWRRAQRDGVPFRAEYRLQCASGAATWVFGQAVGERDSDGRMHGWVGTIIDITERKRAEAALQESEARYRDIFSAAPVSIWEEDFSAVQAMIAAWRAAGVSDVRAHLEAHPQLVEAAVDAVRVVDVNDASLRLFGAQSKSELLSSLSRIFVSETLPIFCDEIVAIANGDRYLESEVCVQTLQGERREALLTMSFPRHPGPVDRVLVSLIDVTERNRAQRSLAIAEREKQDAAHAAADAERRRVARELHDGVLQDLGATKLLLEAQRKRADSVNADQVLLRLRQSLEDIRSVVEDLRTPDANISLQDAIAAHARVLTAQRPIAVALKLEDAAVVDWAVRDLYRIAQEAIGNVVRHAHPAHLNIDLYSQNGDTTLRIADDGTGFDLDAPHVGNGLLGIRERAASLGAELDIATAPGRGTTVRVVVPNGRSHAPHS